MHMHILHIYFISNIRFSIYSTSIISKYSGASYSFENSANELQKISETIMTKKKAQTQGFHFHHFPHPKNPAGGYWIHLMCNFLMTPHVSLVRSAGLLVIIA